MKHVLDFLLEFSEFMVNESGIRGVSLGNRKVTRSFIEFGHDIIYTSNVVVLVDRFNSPRPSLVVLVILNSFLFVNFFRDGNCSSLFSW